MAWTDRPGEYELALRTLWIDLCQGVIPQWPDDEESEEEADAVQI